MKRKNVDNNVILQQWLPSGPSLVRERDYELSQIFFYIVYSKLKIMSSGHYYFYYYYILYLTRLSHVEIKISFARETWPRWTAVHSCNVKHKTKYNFNTTCNSNNTFTSLTKTFAFFNGVRYQSLYNSLKFNESNQVLQLELLLQVIPGRWCKNLKGLFFPSSVHASATLIRTMS